MPPSILLSSTLPTSHLLPHPPPSPYPNPRRYSSLRAALMEGLGSWRSISWTDYVRRTPANKDVARTRAAIRDRLAWPEVLQTNGGTSITRIKSSSEQICDLTSDVEFMRSDVRRRILFNAVELETFNYKLRFLSFIHTISMSTLPNKYARDDANKLHPFISWNAANPKLADLANIFYICSSYMYKSL